MKIFDSKRVEELYHTNVNQRKDWQTISMKTTAIKSLQGIPESRGTIYSMITNYGRKAQSSSTESIAKAQP